MATRDTRDALGRLTELGLTEQEGRTYLALLGREAQTAYALAKEQGWHKANTYKALESLACKGAVSLLDGEHREWRAVPAREFPAGREAAAKRAAADLVRSLGRAPKLGADDRIFALRSADAVLQRARLMLEGAQVLVVADLFPSVVQELRPQLEAAAARGVDVGLRVYEPTQLDEGVEIFDAPDGERILADWDGQMLAMAADAESYLLAHLDGAMEGVLEAMHTSSPHLSMMALNGIASEMILGDLAAQAQDAPTELAAQAERALEFAARFDAARAPGRNRLARRPRGDET